MFDWEDFWKGGVRKDNPDVFRDGCGNVEGEFADQLVESFVLCGDFMFTVLALLVVAFPGVADGCEARVLGIVSLLTCANVGVSPFGRRGCATQP